ncbi:MAG: exopolysaccharide biosynthesis protein [Solirubrobacteraceae bacterium]
MSTPDTSTARLSDQLEAWLQGKEDRTLGALIAAFGDKSFAMLFVLLLGVPALPLPTGGATHVMEIIAALLALELIAGRREVWLPERWRKLELAGPRQQRFIGAVLRLIRRLERISRRRLLFLFGGRLSNRVFGLLVLIGSAGAFFAPPFTGLDTLPALGVVLLSIAVLLEDGLIAAVGILVMAGGIALEIVVGTLAAKGIESLF